MLEQLLDLGLEYASRIGSQVEIGAAMGGRPEHPVLSIRVERAQTPTAADGDQNLNELHCLLFVHLARAVGLAPQRLASARAMTLTLGFPGVDATRTKEVCFSPAQVSHTATAAGHRVLLIEPQGVARVQAHRLMQDAGMSVDAVASIDQARRGLHDGAADVIVTGVPVDDTQWAALLDELRAAQPRLRVVELVNDDDAFAFSVPDADRPARVGRHEMARTLLRAVSQELDAAWAE